MYSIAKNIKKCLRNQKFCVHLYCQNAISHIADTYKLRHKAYPCYTSASCGSSVLANKGGAPFFVYILTNLFLAKCQNAKQVVRGIIVPLLHLYPNYRTSLISQIGRSQSAYNHSHWTNLKSSPRYFVYSCMSF